MTEHKPPRPPTLFPIPPGTRPRRCLRCPDMIYMVEDRPLKVAAECVSRATGNAFATPTAHAPTGTEPGLGFSHFIDCPGAAEFRKRS